MIEAPALALGPAITNPARSHCGWLAQAPHHVCRRIGTSPVAAGPHGYNADARRRFRKGQVFCRHYSRDLLMGSKERIVTREWRLRYQAEHRAIVSALKDRDDLGETSLYEPTIERFFSFHASARTFLCPPSLAVPCKRGRGSLLGAVRLESLMDIGLESPGAERAGERENGRASRRCYSLHRPAVPQYGTLCQPSRSANMWSRSMPRSK